MTQSQVSIVIPVHGRSNLVLRLLNSLKGMKRVSEIVVIDDASPEQDREVLKTLTGVRYFRNDGSAGFIKSVNRAVKKTESPYVLILNSDTEAYHDRCVENMAHNLDDGAAVCGAMLLYPKTDPYRAERIQHAGVAIGFDGFPYHILSNMHAKTPAAQIRRSVTAVTGGCFMVNRDWWNKAGSFDPKFGNGVFEDVSFCLTVKGMGGEIIYEPESTWTHHEHASQGQNGNWFSKDNIHRNFQYLLLKHGEIKSDDKIWYRGV